MMKIVEITETGETVGPLDETTPRAEATGYWQTAKHHAGQMMKGLTLLGAGAAGYSAWRWMMGGAASTPAEEAEVSFSLQSHGGLLEKREVMCPVPFVQEFRVNTYTPNIQQYPAIAGLPDGGFVITWFGAQDSSGDVYAQRYGANGDALGTEFRVNTYTPNYQVSPAIAGLPNGGFVITWYGFGQNHSYDGSDIYAQRYAANGDALGAEFRVNTVTPNSQGYPAIAGFPNGGFVITWQGVGQNHSYDDYDIYAQRYAANGDALGAEFHVNTYTVTSQWYPAIAGLPDGGFVITWYGVGQDRSVNDIYAQRYTANGAALGAEFRVNTYTPNNQMSPAIASLPDGGFVITWEGDGQNSLNYDIYAQSYAANGAAKGAEFRVNTDTPNAQGYPAIAGLPNGGFVITWHGVGQNSSYDDYDIYAQHYAANGEALGAEFRVNTVTPNNQGYPAIASLQGYPAIASLPEGSCVITWTSAWQDGSYEGVYAQRFTPSLLLQAVTSLYPYVEDSPQPVMLNNIYLTRPTYSLPLNVTARWRPPTAGYLTSANAAGVVIDNTLPGQWTASANTVADMNTLLSCLYFSPALDFDQNVTVDLIAQDGVGPDSTLTVMLMGQPVNDIPKLTVNSLTLTEGTPVIFTSRELAATDVDNVSSRLVFWIRDLQRGRFEEIAAPGLPITEFTQQHVMDGQVRFVDDGSGKAPEYFVSVTDGGLITPPSLAKIGYTPRHITESEGFKVGVAFAGIAVVATGLGVGYLAYRHKKERQRHKIDSSLLEGLLSHEGINLSETEQAKSWHFTPKDRKPIVLEPGKAFRTFDASPEDKQKVIDAYNKYPSKAGYSVKSVRVVYNPTSNGAFARHLQKLQFRAGNEAFAPRWRAENEPEWREAVLNQFGELTAVNADPAYPDVKLAFFFHSTHHKSLNGICDGGFANLALTDPGFFGKGIYTTNAAGYAVDVYGGHDRVLLTVWVGASKVYPVIDGDMNKFTMRERDPITGQMVATGNYQNYDSHFVEVEPASNKANEVNYYPVKKGQKTDICELVVFDTAACLLRHIVELQKDLLPSPFTTAAPLPQNDESNQKKNVSANTSPPGSKPLPPANPFNPSLLQQN
jgi:hypothetical protein